MRRRRLRQYLVARGGRCILCVPHDWKAFRDPEERDCIQPCIRNPIYVMEARTKGEALAEARKRFAAESLKAESMP